MTTNETRDTILDTVPLDADGIKQVKKWALDEDDRRKDDAAFVKCPRCYGRHSVHGNYDDLCDRCQRTILMHFPNHASVPHIKAALEKWRVRG